MLLVLEGRNRAEAGKTGLLDVLWKAQGHGCKVSASLGSSADG